jgi:hypothetical protein
MKRVSKGWREFEERLTKTLKAMVEDDYLIISVKQTNRFVQFSAQGAHGMRAEATSNPFLTGSDKLSDGQISWMTELGWHPPTGTPETAIPALDPDGSPNFFRDFRSSPPYSKIAALAVRTFVTVFDVPSPWFLEYKAFDNEGNKKSLPILGLKRTISNPELNTAKLANLLRSTLRERSGISDLDFDKDGDLGLRYGGINIYVRLVGLPPQVRFFAPLVTGVRDSNRLFRRLNEINAGSGPAHLLFQQGVIYAVNDIPAWPHVAEHVIGTLEQISEMADGLDDFLEVEFDGRTGNMAKEVWDQDARDVPEVLKPVLGETLQWIGLASTGQEVVFWWESMAARVRATAVDGETGTQALFVETAAITPDNDLSEIKEILQRTPEADSFVGRSFTGMDQNVLIFDWLYGIEILPDRIGFVKKQGLKPAPSARRPQENREVQEHVGADGQAVLRKTLMQEDDLMQSDGEDDETPEQEKMCDDLAARDWAIESGRPIEEVRSEMGLPPLGPDNPEYILEIVERQPPGFLLDPNYKKPSE